MDNIPNKKKLVVTKYFTAQVYSKLTLDGLHFIQVNDFLFVPNKSNFEVINRLNKSKNKQT